MSPTNALITSRRSSAHTNLSVSSSVDPSPRGYRTPSKTMSAQSDRRCTPASRCSRFYPKGYRTLSKTMSVPRAQDSTPESHSTRQGYRTHTKTMSELRDLNTRFESRGSRTSQVPCFLSSNLNADFKTTFNTEASVNINLAESENLKNKNNCVKNKKKINKNNKTIKNISFPSLSSFQLEKQVALADNHIATIKEKRKSKAQSLRRDKLREECPKIAAEAKEFLRFFSQVGGSWFSPSVDVNVNLSGETKSAVDDLSEAFKDVADSLENAELKVGLDEETSNMAKSLTETIREFLKTAPDQLKSAGCDVTSFMSGKAKELMLSVALISIVTYCSIKLVQTGERRFLAGLACSLGVCALISLVKFKTHIIGFVTDLISRFGSDPGEMKSQGFNDIKETIATFATMGVAYVTIGNAPEHRKLASFVNTLVHAEKLFEGINFTFVSAIKIVEKVVNWLRDKVCGFEPIRLIKEEDPVVEAWVVEVESVYRRIQKNDFPIVQENADIIYALEAKGNKMMTTMVSAKDKKVENALRTYLGVIKAIKAPFDAANLSGYNVRQQPLTIFVRGEPGVGKSVMVNHLLIDLMAAVLPSEMIRSFEKSEMDHIYVRQAEHCYWDGYHNQFCCVFDDFGQARDASGTPDNEYMDLIRASNMFPDVLHMAELQNKGNVNFTSKIILANTNLRTINPNSIHFKEAITRRMDVAVQVFPKMEFCQPGTDGSPENRRLDRTKVALYNMNKGLHRDAWQKDVYDFQLYDFQKGTRLGSVFNYEEMVERCVNVFNGMRVASKAFDMSISATKTAALKKRALNVSAGNDPDDPEAFEREIMSVFQSQAGGSSEADLHEPVSKPPEEFHDVEEFIPDPVYSAFRNNNTKQMSLDEIIHAMSVTDEEKQYEQDEISLHLQRYSKDQLVALSRFVRKKFGTDNVNYILKCVECHFSAAFMEAMSGGPQHMMMLLSAISKDDTFQVFLAEGYPHPGISERFTLVLQKAKLAIKAFFLGITNKFKSFVQRWICYWDLHEVIKFAMLIHVGIALVSATVSTVSMIRGSNRIANAAVETYRQANDAIDKSEVAYTQSINRTEEAYKKKLASLFEEDPKFVKFLEPRGLLDPTVSADTVDPTFVLFDELAKRSPPDFPLSNNVVGADPGQMLSESTNLRQPRKAAKKGHASVKKGFKTQACLDKSAQNIIEKVTHRNLYSFVYNQDVSMGGVLFVKNRTFLYPTHFRHRILAKVSSGVIDPESHISLKPAYNGSILHVPVVHFIERHNYLDVPGKDLTLYRCPALIPPKSDITKFFFPSSMIHTNRDYTVMLTNPKENVVERIFSSHAILQPEKIVDNEDCGKITIKGAMLYHAPTNDGDCGAVLSIIDPSSRHHKLLGLHVAGNHQNLGLASIISSEELQRSLSGLEAQDAQQVPLETEMFSQCKNAPFSLPFEPLYEHDLKVFSPRETTIIRSALYGAWKEPETKPANLQPFFSATGVKDPMAYALSKYCSPQRSIPIAYYRAAADSLYASMSNKLGTSVRRLRVLTFEEAVEGIPGEIDSLPMNTSPGFPYNAMPLPGYPGKTRFFGREELKDFTRDESILLKKRVLEIIEKANKGIRLEHIYSDFLKDERRPIKKVDEGKTRLISCAPLAMTIACRMLTLTFSSLMQEYNALVGFGIGLNPYSNDWDFLARMLSQFGDKNVIAGDYSNHDGSLTLPLMMAAMSVINKFYDDEFVKAREILTLDVGNSRHINWNKVYQWNKGLASGHAWTPLMGTLCNLINVRSAWILTHEAEISSLLQFDENVYMIALGDDLVLTVSDDHAETFSPSRLSKALEILGMTFTDELKNASRDDFRSLHDVSFLKRSFRYESSEGRYVAPLDMSTILEMPFWTKRGSLENVITKDNLWFALKELSLHGATVYNEWAPKLLNASREKIQYTPPLTNWYDVKNVALTMDLHY